MLADIFIKRPRFAGVISIVLFLAGLIALTRMPVEQFPDIVPPQVSVTASYPGAGAEVVEQTVAQVIEDQVVGVDDMIYMSSTAGADGSYVLNVSFEVGTDPDIATVNVQNRVSLAEPLLPAEVRQTGVRVAKKSSSLLMGVALYADSDALEGRDMTNYARLYLMDRIKRIDGVGDASMFGANEFAMRVNLDVDRLAALGLTPADVTAALQSQNLQAAIGRVGGQPMTQDPGLQLNISTKGRLSTPEEFGAIILRAGSDGGVVRIRDVASVDLGEKSSDVVTSFDGKPATLIGIYLAPGGNALATADAIKAAMDDAAGNFPPGMAYEIVSDSSTFVEESIAEVQKTLIEAFVLVVIVVFLFLGSLRATIVPLIAVPVALVGTFAVLQAMGFSLNTVSLLAMVLAIGIVVDDAIVVVEAVETKMERTPRCRRQRRPRRPCPRSPARSSRSRWCCCRCSCRWRSFPGISGQLFQQFAVTVSVSMVISSINALTLSPALCAILLKPHHGPKKGIMGAISRWIDSARDGYTRVAGAIARRAILGLVLLAGAIVLTGGLFKAVPTGFLPSEDQGSFIVETRLPEAASVDRTIAAQREVEAILSELARASRASSRSRDIRCSTASPSRTPPSPSYRWRSSPSARPPRPACSPP